MQPLVQSTNETPQGPLTLRVYVGKQCSGDLYLDDGKSYTFEHGDSLRMHFACEITQDGLNLSIGSHQGTYPAWWKEIRTEVYGWTPKQNSVLIKISDYDRRRWSSFPKAGLLPWRTRAKAWN